MASDKALALWLCRKEFPQRQKVVKQVNSLLGGKKEYNIQKELLSCILVVV